MPHFGLAFLYNKYNSAVVGNIKQNGLFGTAEENSESTAWFVLSKTIA
jgi:hypothetical protein